MIITYHGGYFIKVAQGDTVIAANPFGKNSSRKPIRFGTRIALVSMDHPDMNGVENLSHGDKTPFVISGPGEYEIGGIAISGFPSPKPVGPKGLLNTIYTIELENIHLCILGAMPTAELSAEVVEGIGEVDVLFVPVLGGDVLSPAEAEKVAVLLDAKLVIPIAWDEGGDPPASDFGRAGKQLKLFLKEAGAEGTAAIEKLVLKKKDLEGKEGEVIVLEPLSRA
ncbi:MAG: hypothetical protein A2942_01235 [Candidatus Lloydbacteria bacterium RIFCSPLOWO2_01_FULL_50_20]|uniref:Lactamase n=1 Tax=Candidatus Lloydbacteria bacterium RIFCSPLOWO2_01_FULL_50_20 TaxID=1798665 RepID=A0A1G2DKL1_9BACT|nr:MAG: hypothetical protein A3C13_00780 [Candidatus Lloydbacteria bacterium RIFCSPHIGHO2_02_FULL_50_11]OGZ13450.1 MAG: hypothetical protein A2942_01235 [Candidatus Lloydbacteria bacterium RIFCSPLOWO2_01_FULL_50_20]